MYYFLASILAPLYRFSVLLRVTYRYVLISMVCLPLAACVGTSTTVPKVSPAELAAEQEYQRQMVVAEKLKKERAREKRRLEQETRLSRIALEIMEGGTEICGKLSKNPSLCLYNVKRQESREINAFADGDGITVTSAMISFAKSDDELAVVLGHEYSHNMMSHVDTAMLNSLLGSLVGVALDAVAGTGGSFTRAGAQLGALAHSPGMEQEADYVGLYVTARAGYDISKAPDFWRRMSLKNADAIYTRISHPTNAERFIYLDKTVKEVAGKQQAGLPLMPTLSQVAEAENIHKTSLQGSYPH